MKKKKQSSIAGIPKCFVFLPIVGLLMFLSPIKTVAQVEGERTVETKTDTISNVLKDSLQTTPKSPLNKETSTTDEGQIFGHNEEMPKFPGGDAALLDFIRDNLIYPKEAHEKGIQGRVIISFYIGVDGSVSDVSVVRGVEPSLDAEAVRLINSLPVWTPGKYNGIPVRIKYTIPITFNIDYGDLEQPLKSHSLGQRGETNAIPSQYGDVYTDVDAMPEFPGGDTALFEYLAKRIVYPIEAIKKGIQGVVVCSFIVQADGKVVEIKIEKPVHPILDDEAVKVLKNMPDWTPGRLKGKPVNVKYTMPVTFGLR